MNFYLRLLLVLFLASLMGSCEVVLTTPTPPPGWRSPVYQMLVDDSIFPQDWFVLFPEDTSTDPTTNHVGRRWGHVSGAKAEQAIWRAYTISDAEAKYDSLRNSQFQPSQPLYPGTIFVEFKPPTEISFQSQIADEFHLACGWWRWAYCEVVARYRNYVVDIRMDLQAEHEGVHSDGLPYEEIEKIVAAMDAKFAGGLDTLPTPAPR